MTKKKKLPKPSKKIPDFGEYIAKRIKKHTIPWEISFGKKPKKKE